MNFELDDEQTMLRDTTRELLNRSYDAEKRNATSATDEGWNASVWKQFAELGLLGLPFAEADGGMGAGPVETMVVMTELGRALAPEPYLGGVLIPGGLIASLGSAGQRARLLPALSDGTTLSAFAHTEPGTRWPVATVTTTASQEGSGWTITGVKNPVLQGDSAHVVIVSAALPGGGTGLFLVDAESAGVSRSTYATHDGRRGAQFTFTDAAAEQLGEGGDVTEAIVEAEVRAQAALCAEAIGIMTEALRTDDGLPEAAQAVRRSAREVPDFDASGCRHVRGARTGEQHESVRHHGHRRRSDRSDHRVASEAVWSVAPRIRSVRKQFRCTVVSE